MNEFKYLGSELDLFAAVTNWKTYWSEQIRPYLRGDVLEVGAGIGSNTRFLDFDGAGRWVCLEPDRELCRQLAEACAEKKACRAYEAICGTLASLAGQAFDTIIYIDVLEHIDNDREELNRAVLRLRPGGHIIVLSPAHQGLYSPFDRAIGHFRRYDKASLKSVSPVTLRLERMKYLDSAGLILSAANRLILNQSMPTKAQLGFWDHWVIPISRVLDKIFLYSVGKTIIAVWNKPI
jgi:SAM-dependent methyltransferase